MKKRGSSTRFWEAMNYHRRADKPEAAAQFTIEIRMPERPPEDAIMYSSDDEGRIIGYLARRGTPARYVAVHGGNVVRRDVKRELAISCFRKAFGRIIFPPRRK